MTRGFSAFALMQSCWHCRLATNVMNKMRLLLKKVLILHVKQRRFGIKTEIMTVYSKRKPNAYIQSNNWKICIFLGVCM